MENEPKPAKKVKPGTLKAQRAAEWKEKKAKMRQEALEKQPCYQGIKQAHEEILRRWREGETGDYK